MVDVFQSTIFPSQCSNPPAELSHPCYAVLYRELNLVYMVYTLQLWSLEVKVLNTEMLQSQEREEETMKWNMTVI